MTRIVLQAEASECGLACLAMIAARHGDHLGLGELRARFGTSLQGATLKRLMDIAAAIGLQGRPLRLGMDELRDLRTPCILHWDLNHFVVLEHAGRRDVTIADPARGRRKLSREEVSAHFTGVALELVPNTDFRPREPVPAVTARQLTGRVAGLRRGLALLLLLSATLQAFAVLAPFYMQWVVDQVLVSADRDLLAVLGIGFGLLLLLQVATGLLRGWTVVFLSNQLGLQWMGSVFSHLLKLPLGFFERRHLGDVVSRIGSVQAIRKTLTTSFVEALVDGMMALATLGMMLLYAWKLAAVTLLAVCVYLALRWLSFRPMRNGTERQLAAAAKQQSHLLESIRGIQSIKVACVEGQREAGFANLMNDAVNSDVWLARLGQAYGSASQLVFGAERVAVIWWGATLALQNAFSVGMLIAYLAYKDQFASRVAGLIDKAVEFRMLRLHGERLADIVLTPPEADSVASPHAMLPEEASLEVSGLCFRYAEGEAWILRDCSFRIEAGESVAIVGASGCGKTTLAKVLLGLLPATSGTIAFGGEDLGRLGTSRYRSVVGAVMQEDQLFAGTIAENIAFGDASPDMARAEAAARMASIHADIAAMPMGYHSLVGDMGTTLSGGQKQRVVIARALYRNPRILLLDEATSHLDVERERLVNDTIGELKITRLIIAHRPETIASSDRVLVMQGGRIVREFRPRRDAAVPPSTAGAAAWTRNIRCSAPKWPKPAARAGWATSRWRSRCAPGRWPPPCSRRL